MTNTISHDYIENSLDVQKMLKAIYHHIWLIIGAGLFGFVIAFIYTLTLQPQYQTTAMLQIRTQSPNSMLSDMANKLNNISIVDTELALIPTSYILNPVIKENGLNIIVSPHYFPIFGEWLAKRHHGPLATKSYFSSLQRYAWGGETIQVSQFFVPDDYEEKKFTLITQENNRYQLFSEQGELILTGQVNQLVTSPDYPGLQLKLSSLNAHPGTEFFLQYKEPTAMSNVLAKQLKVTKAGMDPYFHPYQVTGILQLQLTGSEPKRIMTILNAILNYTTAKNLQQKTKEAQKLLLFFKQRLLELKKSLVAAENALNQHHASTNTINISQTTQALSQQLSRIKHTLDRNKARKIGLLQVYTANHPLVIMAERQELELTEKLKDTLSQVKHFPMVSQKETNLERDVKIKTTMYLSILKKMQQLEVGNAGIAGDITILNNATPAVRLPLHRIRIMLLGFLSSLCLCLLVILLKTTFSKRIEDSTDVEDALQIPVHCIVPYSKKQKLIEKQHKNVVALKHSDFTSQLLARRDPKDASIESLRNLQFSLTLLAKSKDHSIISFLGSQSKIGKSFLSLNFAQVSADSGKRTLLIDADLRKGRLHKIFFQSKLKGLGDYLEKKYEFNEILRNVNKNLFFISAGICSLHPIELLQSSRLQELLALAKEHFDQIIIDTPPVLAVTDGLLIARHSSVTFYVVSVNDDLAVVKKSIERSRAYDVGIDSIILNYQHPIVPYGSGYVSYQHAYG